MAIEFDSPKNKSSIIKVIGVGGGGSNAVNHMFSKGIEGVDFFICNTDEQALEMSPVPNKVQLGPGKTSGLGAGNNPEVGRDATIESMDDIKQILNNNTKMLFITAGMGGGTGTGGAPEVARIASDLGVLTVGIVTTPFSFEGKKRQNQAKIGIDELRTNVDTLVVISNDKLREIYGNLKINEAFSKADDILTIAAKGIAEIITKPGYINVDFQDVNTVMRDSGLALMGIGVAEGDDRAIKAIQAAISSPLLNENSIEGAQNILLNISSGDDEIVTMDEIGIITDFAQESAGNQAEIIWGNCVDSYLGDKIAVTIIATGFDKITQSEISKLKSSGKVVHRMDTDGKVSQQDHLRQMIAKEREDLNQKRHIELEIDDTAIQDEIENDMLDNYDQEEEKIRLMSKDEIEKVKSAEKVKLTDEEEEMASLRTKISLKNRLKNLSLKLSSPRNVTQLEDEPAYKRRNIELTDGIPSDQSHHSDYSINLDENNKGKLYNKNSYLHDLPD